MSKDETLMNLLEYTNTLNEEEYSMNSWRELETALKYSKYTSMADIDRVIAIEMIKKAIKNLHKVK